MRLGSVSRPVGSIGLTMLAVALVSCGGTSAKHAQRAVERPQTGAFVTHRSPTRVPPASSIAMTETPRALLAVCLGNTLLHPICSRLGPVANQPHTTIQRLGFCYDPAGHDLLLHGRYALLASGRCVDADWGYEAAGESPCTAGTRLSGWDGRSWLPLPFESLLFSPPLHVHVEIEASRGSLIGGGVWPTGAHPVSDALLDPKRPRAVSLGWVRWYGEDGQLVLEPVFPFGGEWGGHLVFRFTAGHVSYAITLHAWMPALRLTAAGINRVIRFQSGPALPHVIATLKAIVGSAL